MKKVSVIVPVYNTEKYLHRCIESILDQTYKMLELILIDDGSTDSSGIICDEVAQKDTRVKVLHKKNEGAGEARNCGINIAQGEYICFVDSDDYISSRYIEIMYMQQKNMIAGLSNAISYLEMKKIILSLRKKKKTKNQLYLITGERSKQEKQRL